MKKVEHYHGLLAPCPHDKLKTVEIKTYEGKVVGEMLLDIKPCSERLNEKK